MRKLLISGLDARVGMAHIRQALAWARGKNGSLDGDSAKYDQNIWSATDVSCGTRCCIWGAAFRLANGKFSTKGPSAAWGMQSKTHEVIRRLLEECEETGGVCKDDHGDEVFFRLLDMATQLQDINHGS